MGDVVSKTSVRSATPSVMITVYDDETPGPDIGEGPSRESSTGPLRRHRLRGLVELLLIVVVAGAALLGIQLTRSHDTGRGATAAQTTERAAIVAAGAAPRYDIQGTARAGESLRLIEYRDSRFCGASEIRFDKLTIGHRIDAVGVPSESGLVQVFMSIDIPSAATLGTHQIQMYGLVSSRGFVCGEPPERQQELAVVDVLIVA
jgi:hypothetical protein